MVKIIAKMTAIVKNKINGAAKLFSKEKKKSPSILFNRNKKFFLKHNSHVKVTHLPGETSVSLKTQYLSTMTLDNDKNFAYFIRLFITVWKGRGNSGET